MSIFRKLLGRKDDDGETPEFKKFLEGSMEGLRLQTEAHQGALPGEHSFVQVQPDNVVLTAVKKAEDGNSLVLRFYEWAGTESDVKLQLPPGAQTAQDADLMERPISDLPLQSGMVTVHTKPYEIKTVKVKFALPPITEPVEAAK